MSTSALVDYALLVASSACFARVKSRSSPVLTRSLVHVTAEPTRDHPSGTVTPGLQVNCIGCRKRLDASGDHAPE